MAFEETKVYFDGSHYIAIPHTTRPCKIRPKRQEEKITIIKEDIEDFSNELESSNSSKTNENIKDDIDVKIDNNIQNKQENKPKNVITITKKELFNTLYSKYINLSRKQRKEAIIKDISPYFENDFECEKFVNENIERKLRNLICRRIRMIRKANLVDFNYFCTFTYDDKLHTEQSFKNKLQGCFKMMCYRRKWKYMGVWERAPQTKRLHFHGLFSIPNGSMVGELIEHSDYNFNQKRRTLTMQNTYFNSRFGRSDFEEIKSNKDLMKEIQYICKYLEKTEEKIVYSKGLYQYFISDIRDEDIVCTIGQEDKKLLLFDDFMCLDEGEILGKVEPSIIAKMRKCN